MNVVKPIIERFGEDIPIDEYRKRAAADICEYFENRRDTESLRLYYNAVEYLLRHRDSARILLYLPFEELESAPRSFKKSYLDTWYSLLYQEDVRENFFEGDCFELDARPEEGLERIIKCMHIVPWLISSNIIDFHELMNVMISNDDYMLLVDSFRDACDYMRQTHMLTDKNWDSIGELLSCCRVRRNLKPRYVSNARIKWLQERGKKPGELSTPNARLEGPFSPNLRFLTNRLEELKDTIEPNEVVLIGGSQLKGYGTLSSDFDVWKLNELEKHPYLYPGSPDGIHVYFNTVWMGGDNVHDLAEIAKEKMKICINGGNRRLLLERLESDLLQYRLLHKGFSRFTGRKRFDTSKYEMIDGDCPFYNDEYRRIATMLYAKYVLIPDFN